MKSSEVVQAINEIQNTYGDLDVFCQCDHGQDPESVFSVTESHAVFQDGEVVELHPDDLQDYDEDEVSLIIMIN